MGGGGRRTKAREEEEEELSVELERRWREEGRAHFEGILQFLSLRIHQDTNARIVEGPHRGKSTSDLSGRRRRRRKRLWSEMLSLLAVSELTGGRLIHGEVWIDE